MTTATPPSLAEIASCVSGYDPNALPVAQAQEFSARRVPRVQEIKRLALQWRTFLTGTGRDEDHLS